MSTHITCLDQNEPKKKHHYKVLQNFEGKLSKGAVPKSLSGLNVPNRAQQQRWAAKTLGRIGKLWSLAPLTGAGCCCLLLLLYAFSWSFQSGFFIPRQIEHRKLLNWWRSENFPIQRISPFFPWNSPKVSPLSRDKIHVPRDGALEPRWEILEPRDAYHICSLVF